MVYAADDAAVVGSAASPRPEVIRYAVVETSLGWLLVACSKHGLCAVSLGDDADDLIAALARRFPNARLTAVDPHDNRWAAAVASAVADPVREVPDELPPLDLRGTPFQLEVWQQLITIPAGTTVSYSDLARRVRRPHAVRAVAQACGANPVSVIVPCHRVVGRDGSLTGYASGIERKRVLLEREGVP